MKKIIKNLFFFVLPVSAMILFAFSKNDDAVLSSGNIKSKSEWVKKHLLDKNPMLPFSFNYDGKVSSELLNGWQKKSEINKPDENRKQYNLFFADSKTGLEVRCTAVEYSDFPVVEWTVYLKNTGTSNTPVLKDIQGLDAVFQRGSEGEFVLNGIKGDFCTADSYEPYQLTLAPGFTKTFAPSKSGKSSDGPDGWPYYNLQMPDGGIILAIGWPGQWSSSFTRDNSDGLVIKAGQQLTNLYLKPGEEIRTPSITLLFWQGAKVVDAQNLWRRFYIAHIIPRIDGVPQQPTMQIQVGGAEKDTSYVNSFLQAGIRPDICWRDAGGTSTWYPSDNGPYKGNDAWLNTGTWEIDQRLYPDGFKPYTDWIHNKGMKFVLWFEPERVGDPDSWLSKNHPDWLLPGTSHGALLNEGNPEALNWLVNHVDGMIKSQGIDWYREDMNGGGPLPAWRKNDGPGRQGINENFYVQGHLAFWDELKRRNPQLRIDACASGGRRNDLETMRRAVPLLRSDFQWESMDDVIEGNQGQTYGLSSWLPFQGTGVYFYDAYSYRSFYMSGFGMGGLNPENTAAQQKAYSECREIAPAFLFGDYYPLTPYSLQHGQWIAWQFNDPDQGNGFVQAFRRDSCNEAETVFLLNGLEEDANYKIKNFDLKGTTVVSGSELMQKGLKIEIVEKPGAAIVSYKKIESIQK